MPGSIDDYFQSVLILISDSPLINSSNVVMDKRTLRLGMIRGDLYFNNGSRLHFRELIEVLAESVERFMYSYHYQDSQGILIFRYDDTPHFPELNGFPHHKHTPENVSPAGEIDLESVLREIKEGYPLQSD